MYKYDIIKINLCHFILEILKNLCHHKIICVILY